MALAQSIITEGIFPASSSGPNGWGSAASLGMVITTAFDPAKVDSLTPLHGQILPGQQNTALFSLLRNDYGGDGRSTNFALPDLGGKAVQYLTPSDSSRPLNGLTVGNANNEVSVRPDDLPQSLGGSSFPLGNRQDSVGIQYLIKTSGLYPSGEGPNIDTIGMVYPFAGTTPGGVPDGFMLADGSLLSIAQHTVLFSVIGNTYGGDGRTTFALPDLRQHVPIGAGQARIGEQTANIAVGQRVGDAEFNLVQAQLPLNGEPAAQPLNTLQPSLGMHYVLATDGLFEHLGAFESTLGQVLLYAGRRIPEDWTLAHGQVLPVSQNQKLAFLLGNTFGGDGNTTFALPDLRGRTVVGTGGEQNLQLGDTQGSFSEQITMANIPELVVPVPGVHLVDEDGHSIGAKVTGAFEVDISGVWPLATVQYSSDGGKTWSESFQAQEGSNSLMVRQVDVLGQASQPTNPINFELDTTAPEVPRAVVDQAVTTAMMFVNDAQDTPDDTDAPLRTSSGQVSLLGGVSPSSEPPDFVVDNEAPDASQVVLDDVSTVTSDNAEPVARTSTGKLSFTDVEEGARLEFSIDGGKTWTDSFEAEPGLNQVQVRQIDVAGNVSPASEVVQFYWERSDTEPAVTTTSAYSAGGNEVTVQQYGALSEGLGTDSVDVLIYGYQQDVVLPDDIEQVRLTEDGLNNTVTGNALDNVFEVMVGNWVIEGAGGQDTVVLSNAMADYAISQASHEEQLQATLDGPEGRIVVRGVETIRFSDSVLEKVEGAELAQIDHLYEEVLGRNPDMEGLTYWAEKMNQGASLTNIAQGMAGSAEFKQLYGSPSDEQLVEELYESILDRAPEAEGLSYWVEQLVVHDLSEGQLITSLLLSAESQQASASQVSGDGLFLMG